MSNNAWCIVTATL